jgi:hypothetical protein
MSLCKATTSGVVERMREKLASSLTKLASSDHSGDGKRSSRGIKI